MSRPDPRREGAARFAMRNRRKGFQNRGDLRIRDPEIAEASLRPDRNYSAVDQFSQMTAGALRRDAGGSRQFACRQRAAVGKRNQHGLGAAIGEQLAILQKPASPAIQLDPSGVKWTGGRLLQEP